VPTAQFTQGLVAVVDVPYLPARQTEQEEEPALAAYDPMVHAVHWADVLADATSPYEPALQAVHSDVPVVRALYVPATHVVQAEAPVSVLYVPAAHDTHALPEVYVPEPHTVQKNALKAASEVNKPTSHGAHTEVPTVTSL
jgi:hypothetical protein